jgi:hypothetical protein
MSKGLTEKRKLAIDELVDRELYKPGALDRAINRAIDSIDFAGLAAWCQQNLTPSTQLDRICDALWEG